MSGYILHTRVLSFIIYVTFCETKCACAKCAGPTTVLYRVWVCFLTLRRIVYTHAARKHPGEIVREERVVSMPGGPRYPLLDGGTHIATTHTRTHMHLFFFPLPHPGKEREGKRKERSKVIIINKDCYRREGLFCGGGKEGGRLGAQGR